MFGFKNIAAKFKKIDNRILEGLSIGRLQIKKEFLCFLGYSIEK